MMMMGAKRLRSSVLLSGKSKNTMFCPWSCVCLKGFSLALLLKLYRGKTKTILYHDYHYFCFSWYLLLFYSFITGGGSYIAEKILQKKSLLCVDVKVICSSRVFIVMDGCSKQGCHHLELCQPVLDRHKYKIKKQYYNSKKKVHRLSVKSFKYIHNKSHLVLIWP